LKEHYVVGILPAFLLLLLFWAHLFFWFWHIFIWAANSETSSICISD